MGLLERIKNAPESDGVKLLLYREAATELLAILKVQNLLNESANEANKIEETPGISYTNTSKVRVEGHRAGWGDTAGCLAWSGAAGGSPGCLGLVLAASWVFWFPCLIFSALRLTRRMKTRHNSLWTTRSSSAKPSVKPR